MSDEVSETKPLIEPVCPNQRNVGRFIELEFAHTAKRLNRKNIVPLVQFSVFAYNCYDSSHGEDQHPLHIDCSSIGSNIAVPNGLAASIAATEALLAALKAKVQ